MDASLIIRHADTEDINSIGFLAHQIWPATYGHIIAKEQLDYMLQMMYSPESLKKQMQAEHVFLIAELDEEPVGFASYAAAEPGKFKLHKIYVRTDIQGKGLGKALINAVAEEVKEQNAHCLRLNVNRHNKAKDFYERLGFVVVKEEDIDIGRGYFMNDYVMEKAL
jgi:ribosomal protein S18 acetylase RimI-like enzyme